MTIIAFSDVHLGYDKSNSEDFLEFLDYLESRNDIEDIVIVGDFIDLWRRDVVGLQFEISSHIEKLKKLQKKCRVHYVIGNHDFHVRELKRYSYPFKFVSSLRLEKVGYKIFFLHGYQCDLLQMVAYPRLLELLCWTLSDDLGKKKSKIWEMLPKEKHKLSKKEFYAHIDKLYKPPESKVRSKAFGLVNQIEQCMRKRLKKVKKDEFIVFGHTHEACNYFEDRIANTGSWVKSSEPTNTYFEFSKWPPKVISFKRNEIKPMRLIKDSS